MEHTPKVLSRRRFLLALGGLGISGFAGYALTSNGSSSKERQVRPDPGAEGPETTASSNRDMQAKFEFLSTHGNSTCSRSFLDSIASMPVDPRLQGSCCSPMSWHRYSEQVAGLRRYAVIAEIPPDPYDVEAGRAARLISYYDMSLTPEEQAAYDYAMEHSSEEGPCCCRCWRWQVYGGLGRHLIRTYGFNGEQLTEVWDLSDGCGGDSEHHHSRRSGDAAPGEWIKEMRTK